MKLACPPLLRETPAGWVLLGSRCEACGEPYFPLQRGCTRCCGTQLMTIELGRSGTLWSWTVQGFPPKPPYNGDDAAPGARFEGYGVGYVEMPCGVKVESRLTVADPAQLRIGMPMQLVLQAYRHEAGEPVATYAFAPQEAGR